MLGARGVDADEDRPSLAHVIQHFTPAVALDPAAVSELDRHRLKLFEDRVEL